MKIAAGWLAIVGFLLSIAAHVAAAFGVDVREYVPMIWFLHVGVFVVGVPAVLVLSRRAPSNGSSFLLFLRGLPVWARAFTVSLCIYVVFNFVPFFFGAGLEGVARVKDHRYVLQHKGELVRELTAAEYHSRRAQELQVFSGHWLFFYFFSFAVLVLYREEPEVRRRGDLPQSLGRTS